MKSTLCLVGIIFFSFSHAQYTETINSNRPGASFGAYSVGTNVIQAEGGVGFGNDKHELLNTDTDLIFVDYALRYGLILEELEVILEGRYLSVDITEPFGTSTREISISNFESNTIGAKYLVYDPHKKKQVEGPNLYSYHANNSIQWSDLIPAISAYAGLNILTGENPFMFENEPSVSPKLAISTQNNFDKTVLVINFIADKVSTDFPSYSGIITVTHALNSNYSVFGEFQTTNSDIYSDELFRAGGAYLFNKNFQLDLFGLVNFKDTPKRWLVGLGLSYRWDRFHKDKLMKMGNDK